jgi:single-strand DNA-binding protein
MVDARADWREWQDQQGNKRQSVTFIADNVQFLGTRDGGSSGASSAPASSPSDTFDPVNAGAGTPADDDIPF